VPRLSAGTVTCHGAHAPYGESYAETGTPGRVFAGMPQNMITTGAYPPYDALMREQNATWGRWLSPDPAGLAAANPANPQSWNRYAYVGNNPLSFIDPLGLQSGCSPEPSADQGYWPGSFINCPTNAQLQEIESEECSPSGLSNSCSPGYQPGSENGAAEAKYINTVNAVFEMEFLNAEYNGGVPLSKLQAYMSAFPNSMLAFGLLASDSLEFVTTWGVTIADFNLYGWKVVDNPLQLAGLYASPVASPWMPVAWYGTAGVLAIGGGAMAEAGPAVSGAVEEAFYGAVANYPELPLFINEFGRGFLTSWAISNDYALAGRMLQHEWTALTEVPRHP
jgi:RHS repeat-associated protein